jgi:homoserine O-succinyltransferase
MEWTKTHVHSAPSISAGEPRQDCIIITAFRNICWMKSSSAYSRIPLSTSAPYLFRGFDDVFYVPHSRHTTIDRADIEAVPELRILASSEEAGVYAIFTKKGRQIFITGHSEYDADTLPRNISVTWRQASRSLCQRTIILMMIRQRNRLFAGGHMQTCCIPTG